MWINPIRLFQNGQCCLTAEILFSQEQFRPRKVLCLLLKPFPLVTTVLPYLSPVPLLGCACINSLAWSMMHEEEDGL